MHEPETTQPATGTCVRCRQTKPESLFRRNAAGSRTAWCESCRVEKAKAWGVDEDLIEVAHALYVLEESFKTEALMLARSQGHGAEVATASTLRILDMNRPMRIPARVREIVEQYRRAYYNSMGMDAPSLSPAEALSA